MNNIRSVAANEFLEQRRQPWMVVALNLSLLFFPAILVVTVVLFEAVLATPEIGRQVAAMFPEYGHLGTAAGVRKTIDPFVLNFVVAMFAGPFGIAALSLANSIIHDRNEGTLPFLMLAPMSRFDLLLGKVLGAVIFPLGSHLLINGLATLVSAQFSVVEGSAALLGSGAAWWIAFLINVPLGTALTGSLAVILSALSSDARTSYQLTNIVLALGSLLLGGLVVGAIQFGTLASIVLSALLLGATAASLLLGANLMSRDFVR